jgi:uroporphyrinogen-III synthase
LLHGLDKGEIKAVAVFSARGGGVFSDLIEQYGRAVRLKSVMALCMSDLVVQSVSVLPFQQSVIAAKPDRYGMMELVDNIP